MSRPFKKGLDYFPLDADIFRDIKIRKLIKAQGTSNGVLIYIAILCRIYKKCYYIEWDNDMPFIISEDTDFDENFISETLKNCINVDLFDEKTFIEHTVLTSKSIQHRYMKICEEAKRKHANIEIYDLINSVKTIVNPELTLFNPEETGINPEETLVNGGRSTQRKVKESKGKESKGKKGLIPELKIYTHIWKIYNYSFDEYKTILNGQAKNLSPEIFDSWKKFVDMILEKNYLDLFSTKFVFPIDFGKLINQQNFTKEKWEPICEKILATGVKPENNLYFRIPQYLNYQSKKNDKGQIGATGKTIEFD